MGYNFIRGHDPYQPWLIPPSYAELLGEHHPVFKVMELVDDMDTRSFRTHYREDGKGGSAFEPDMMVGVLLYSYMNGITSSRKIERACREHLAFMAMSRNSKPDHTTISRFRNRNSQDLAGLFAESIRLCAAAGLVDPSVIAIDGTRMQANASMDSNRELEFFKKSFRDWARQGDRIDAEEDKIYGEEGYERPKIDEAKMHRLVEEFNRRIAEVDRKVEEHGKRQEERQEQEEESGRKIGGVKPKPPAELRQEVERKVKINTTDPDSRIVKGTRGFMQGYNPQIAVTTDQIIVAASVNTESNDWNNLFPVTEQAIENVEAAGVREKIETVVADAGYASKEVLAATEDEEWKERGMEFFLATKKERNQARELKTSEATTGEPPERVTDPRRRMEHRLKTEKGRAAFRKRAPSVEPVFAHIKACRGLTHFSMRGAQACDAEWKLMAAAHNLLKLMRFCPQSAES